MPNPDDTIDVPADYAQRRSRLAQTIQQGVVVLPTAPEQIRNRDAHYAYRYDSYFYYLTGFAEPEAVLVIIAGATPRHILFCRERDAERETWEGFRHGTELARGKFGFDETHAISELDEVMPKLLADQPQLYCHLGSDSHWDTRVLGWLNAVRAQARAGVAAPAIMHDLHPPIDEMRLIKDTH